MDHIAIMKKSWGLLPKILSGEKKIESRWYMAKFAPWDKINAGDTVYFKDSGGPVTVKTQVGKVLQFPNYGEAQLEELIHKYGGIGGICFHSSPQEVFEWAKKRKYCILIFLKDPQKVPPFNIDKTGFGNACAWLAVENVNKIRV